MSLSALLLVSDQTLKDSITFMLEAEGFVVLPVVARAEAPSSADCIVIDHCGQTDQLEQLLVAARTSAGSDIPIIVVASNPTAALRRILANARAELVEKPLLTDCLVEKLRRIGKSGEDRGLLVGHFGKIVIDGKR